MPYIDQNIRNILDPRIQKLYDTIDPLNPEGELNYCITRLIHLYVLDLIVHTGKKSYHLLGQGHKILTDATKEYYRKVMGPYEDSCRIKNGAVSDLDAVQLEDVR